MSVVTKVGGCCIFKCKNNQISVGLRKLKIGGPALREGLKLPSHRPRGQQLSAVDVTSAFFCWRIVTFRHLCNMSYPTTPCLDFPPETPRTWVTRLWHDPSPLRYLLTTPMLCKPIRMGNVQRHACPVVFRRNVSKTGRSILISVKHGN